MNRSPAPASPAPASAGTGAVRPGARARWPLAGRGQGLVLLGALLAVLGSLLPWVQTAFGTFDGLAGGGMYTFAAAWIGVAGGFLRARRAAAVHGAVTGVVCVGLPAWQVAHLWALGLGAPWSPSGWAPGAGLGIVLLGGLLALRGAWLLRGPRR